MLNLGRMFLWLVGVTLLELGLLLAIARFADDLDIIRNTLHAATIISVSIAIAMSYAEIDPSQTRWIQELKRAPLYVAVLSPLVALLISWSPDLQGAATYPSAAYGWASKYTSGTGTARCDCWEEIASPHPLEWSEPVMRVSPQYTGDDYYSVDLLDKAFILYTSRDLPLAPAVYIAIPGDYAASPGERLPLESTLPNALYGEWIKFGRTMEVVGWYYDWPDEYPIGDTEILVFKHPHPERD